MSNSSVAAPEARSQESQAFLRALLAVESALDADARVEWPVLQERLNALLNDLVHHFRLEEEGGYLNSVAIPEAAFETARKQLLVDHEELQQTLAVLVAQANASDHLDDTLRDKLREWARKMSRHEEQEINLIQDAVDVEVGGEAGGG